MSNDRLTRAVSRAAGLGIALVLVVPGAALAAKPADRNHDRLPDRWERAHHLSLHAKQARRDPDHDGLRNLAEYRAHTDPRKADTDRDGLRDGAELAVGDDPLDPDTDGDGVRDGDEHAGTVLSFDGTTLILKLAGGGTLTGQVDDATEVWCGDEGDLGDGSGDGTDPADSGDPADTGDPADAGDDTAVDARASRAGLDTADAPDDTAGDTADDPTADDPAGDSGDDPAADDSGDGSDLGGDCSTDDLAAGVAISEADISLTGQGAVYDSIELAPAG